MSHEPSHTGICHNSGINSLGMEHRRNSKPVANDPPEPSPLNAQPRLTIVYRRLEEIRPNPRNPRRHSRAQIRNLARNIRALKCNVPLVLDREWNLLAGHARFEACKSLGLTE